MIDFNDFMDAITPRHAEVRPHNQQKKEEERQLHRPLAKVAGGLVATAVTVKFGEYVAKKMKKPQPQLRLSPSQDENKGDHPDSRKGLSPIGLLGVTASTSGGDLNLISPSSSSSSSVPSFASFSDSEARGQETGTSTIRDILRGINSRSSRERLMMNVIRERMDIYESIKRRVDRAIEESFIQQDDRNARIDSIRLSYPELSEAHIEEAEEEIDQLNMRLGVLHSTMDNRARAASLGMLRAVESPIGEEHNIREWQNRIDRLEREIVALTLEVRDSERRLQLLRDLRSQEESIFD